MRGFLRLLVLFLALTILYQCSSTKNAVVATQPIEQKSDGGVSVAEMEEAPEEVVSQNALPPKDTISVISADSLEMLAVYPTDSVNVEMTGDSTSVGIDANAGFKTNQTLTAPVENSAQDSIVFTAGNMDIFMANQMLSMEI
jgi:hypothetical protein